MYKIKLCHSLGHSSVLDPLFIKNHSNLNTMVSTLETSLHPLCCHSTVRSSSLLVPFQAIVHSVPATPRLAQLSFARTSRCILASPLTPHLSQ